MTNLERQDPGSQAAPDASELLAAYSDLQADVAGAADVDWCAGDAEARFE